MGPEREQERAVARAPQLDVVVPARTGDPNPVRGEGDVVDLFLVAEEPAHGLGAGRRRPEIDGEIVAGGHEPFDDGIVHRPGFLKPRERLGELVFGGDGNGRRVIVVGGTEGEVGGECEVVDPMSVGGKGLGQGAIMRVPDFDSLVVGGCIYLSSAAPPYA